MESDLFMGIDISQDTFNFCLRNRFETIAEGQVANAETPIKLWLRQLQKQHQVKLDHIHFCMEHTGVYGSILLRILASRSMLTYVESARNIKLSLGMQRGKNDRVDAQRIAVYALRNFDRLHPWQPKRPILERLQLLIRLRERLIKARTEISRFNQDAKRFLPKTETQLVIKGSERTLQTLAKDIDKVDRDIEILIQGDEKLKHLNELVTSIDGVGIVTSSSILVKTNEFNDYTEAKKFACTAGVAPFEHTSGKSIRGKTRVSHHAHKDIKTLLHMCAVGSISRKGKLQDYYKRKVAQGKNKMLVLNAVRNKLIHLIFAVVRNNTMYQKDYQYNLQMP